MLCCRCDSVNKTSLKKNAMKGLRRFVPVVTWAPRMSRKFLLDDVVGGFIVGVMIVPTCLSWASLAGLPLSCGLSAALVASFSYGTFGQCAALSLGPVAEITTLLISISGIPLESREKAFQSLGVQVGLLSMALSFIDGGKVIKTIFAKAVGDGYTCAAALLAISVQVKVMFNVSAPAATLIQDVIITTIKALVAQMTLKSVYCFLLFMVYCLYLIYIKKCGLPLWIPHQLIVVVLSTTVTWYFRLDEVLGLTIVRDIPAGISWPHFPPWNNVIALGPYTITVTMISFIQMYVIASRVMPDINPNAELFAGGMTNFLVNVFSGMPVTNSFSCSSVLMEQRVHTPMTSYAAGTVLLITTVFLTRLGIFYYLPKQALAAIVVASVVKLVDFSGFFKLWRYSKKDAATWILTFILTIFGGITIGVLSGIMLSLVLVVLRIARPRAVSVGFNMNTFRYGDIRKDPELLVYPSILMWRFDAPLYFVNTGYFKERLMKAIKDEVRPIDVVVVTCGKVVDIDAAALAALPIILDSLTSGAEPHPRRIILTDIHGRLEKVLLESAALPMYVPDEYNNMTMEQIELTGKFPVVFKKLEDAIPFAQRYVSELCGNVDTEPYPQVAFLTDVVVEAARMQDLNGTTNLVTAFEEDASLTDDSRSAFPPTMLNQQAEEVEDGEGDDRTPAVVHLNLALCLQRLRKISTYTPDRELIGVIGVIRHTEVTPKQKKKIIFSDAQLLQLAFGDHPLANTKRTPEELHSFLQAVEERIGAGQLDRSSWGRALGVIRSGAQGLRLQVKPLYASSKYTCDLTLESHGAPRSAIRAGLLVVKWGGVLTDSGIAQAHELGKKLFARFFAAGDIALRRLPDFTRNPTVVAADETRVIKTALVVTNAIMQNNDFNKGGIILDDDLMKRLSPVAKRMLHDEYRYFEALMHIDTSAAARHFFHLPGFRQLLVIPPLDRILNSPMTVTAALRDQLTPTNRGFALQGASMYEDISFIRDSHLRRPGFFEEEYYTPLQVLNELRGVMEVIAREPLPQEILAVPLSNHETLNELRLRYEAMLHNFLGAKRSIGTTSYLCKATGAEKPGADAAAASHVVVNPDGSSSQSEFLTMGDGSSEEDGDPVLDEILQLQAEPSDASTAATPTSAQARHETQGVHPAGAAGELKSTVDMFATTRLGPTFAPHPAHRHDRTKYDVSDVSKLRDYGSYDKSYNLPILHELEMANGLPGLRHTIDALQRFFRITEYLSRVGENTLEGINSSKRFIIGSLVSGQLLERVNRDYHELARLDESRGVRELLKRAQEVYMAERAGVEQDFQQVVKIGERFLRRLRKSKRAVSISGEETQETTAEREFRLRFPFISLPKEDAPRREGEGGTSDPSYTRLYFTSYLHVEGVLQCLFESSTVYGFSRPNKEEQEACQQLYMKHLIFKVFRRRNISFTDAEALNGFRKLKLLFRSDVDYDRQQRELRAALARLYHSMYYVSMEAYLSMGDAEAVTDISAPLFTVHGSSAAAFGDPPGPAANAEDGGEHEASTTLAESQRASEEDEVPGEEPNEGHLSSPHRLSAAPPKSTQKATGERTSPGSSLAATQQYDSDQTSAVVSERHVGAQALTATSNGSSTSESHQPHGRRQRWLSTVMMAPPAGLVTAQVRQMKNRVTTVTPMRRIHEGISLEEFLRLILEVQSAVRSQNP